jgi:branched-chain amino acid transport system permease protein
MSTGLPNTPEPAGTTPEQDVEAYTPPRWEQHLGWLHLAALVIAAVVLLRLPMVSSAYTITLTLTVLLVIALSSSWNWLSGFGGYTSFATAGFFGIGSYTYALLLHYEKMSWIPAVLVAGVLTGVVGFLVGIPTLRLRGPYFAIAMLAFTELARVIVLSWDQLTLGGQGVFLRFPRRQRVEEGMSFWEEFEVVFTNNQTYYAMLALAVLAMIWSYIVGTSRWGLKLLAIRDDEIAAESMGIRTTYVKVTTFAGSAIFPGVAGAIYARHIGYIDPPTVFAIIWSIRAITTTIFGGRGTILGPIIGSVILTLVSEEVWAQDPNLYQIIYGGIIILVMLFMPGGLISLLQGRNLLPRSRRI